jgi:hypothetical protein
MEIEAQVDVATSRGRAARAIDSTDRAINTVHTEIKDK